MLFKKKESRENRKVFFGNKYKTQLIIIGYGNDEMLPVSERGRGRIKLDTKCSLNDSEKEQDMGVESGVRRGGVKE